MSIAYVLRAEYEGTVEGDGGSSPRFLGGIVRAGDRDLDVAAELDSGGGRIVVDESDTAAVLALDGYPALKRAPAGDDSATVPSRYEAMNLAALRAVAATRDLTTAGSKAELVARLEANDAAVAAGDQPTANDPTPEA